MDYAVEAEKYQGGLSITLYIAQTLPAGPNYPKTADTLGFVMLIRVLPKRALPPVRKVSQRSGVATVNHHLVLALLRFKPVNEANNPQHRSRNVARITGAIDRANAHIREFNG